MFGIAVLKFSGFQGGSVADVFLTEPGWRIRGITRDVTKPAAKSLSAKGIEMVQGDLNQVSSIRVAFEGANAIYAVTDFWAPFFTPSTKEKLQPGQILNEYCHDLELQQGKNLADAAATVKTLERYVYSGLTNFKELSKGKYNWVYHFDSKAKVVDYIKENLSDLAAKMSVVQIGLYATHWATAPALAPQKVTEYRCEK